MSVRKSTRLTAKGAQLQESKKLILSIRKALQKTQKALAGDLGVSTIAVSDWERGVYPPSAESWAKLGNLVPDHRIAAECWKRARIDRDRMLQVSELLLKERGASLAGVDLVHVPSIAAILQGVKYPASAPRPVPRWMLPNPGATYFYAEVQHFGVGDYRLGDTLLIEANSRLPELRSPVIAGYRILSRAAKRKEKDIRERSMKREGWGLDESSRFGPQGLFVGKLQTRIHDLSQCKGTTTYWLDLGKDEPLLLAVQEESSGKVRFTLDGNVQILGSVVAWADGGWDQGKWRLDHVLEMLCAGGPQKVDAQKSDDVLIAMMLADYPHLREAKISDGAGWEAAKGAVGLTTPLMAQVRTTLRELRDRGALNFDEVGDAIKRIRVLPLGYRVIEKQSFDPAVLD